MSTLMSTARKIAKNKYAPDILRQSLKKKNYKSPEYWKHTAKETAKDWTPGYKSAIDIKHKNYKDAFKHAVSDSAFWGSVALPDRGFASGYVLKHIANKILFARQKAKRYRNRSKTVKKITEIVFEYRAIIKE